MKKVFEHEFYGKKIVVEHGELAKQADGAVLVRYGDTVLLSTVVISDNADVLSDFFPLMVLYQEKLYSVGKIPGGFIKREGRPTDAATLAARMIDRPMRPMFPEEFRNEVQVVNTVLSVDTDNSPELTAMFGSSLCTSISAAPFDGPIAGVKVGRIDGKFVINPTPSELEQSDIDLTVAGTKKAINMVEAGSKEVSEADMLDALMFGEKAVKALCEFNLLYAGEVSFPCIAAAHLLQYPVGTRLHRQVYVVADVIVRRHRVQHLVRDVLGVGSGESDAHLRHRLGNSLEKGGEIHILVFV